MPRNGGSRVSNVINFMALVWLFELAERLDERPKGKQHAKQQLMLASMNIPPLSDDGNSRQRSVTRPSSRARNTLVASNSKYLQVRDKYVYKWPDDGWGCFRPIDWLAGSCAECCFRKLVCLHSQTEPSAECLWLNTWMVGCHRFYVMPQRTFSSIFYVSRLAKMSKEVNNVQRTSLAHS